MEVLPAADERKWLGRYLRKLIERRGCGQFVAAPILLPLPAVFPVQWNGKVADVHRLTQHLMYYAGLAHLDMRLTGFTADDLEGVMDAGTAGWFAGIEHGRALFGVHVAQLRDAEGAVGVMAHEVAHAWRAEHKLVAEVRDREELLTDLTTVYLGFGVLTTNNTDRYRTSGGYGYTAWSSSSAGYLPTPAMAWLLALQVAARDYPREAHEVEAQLEPNQRASFRAALKELATAASWIEALQLPPRAEWPARRAIERVAVFEPEVDGVDDPAPKPLSTARNAGLTIPRLAQPELFLTAFVAAIAGTVLGFVILLLVFGDDASDTATAATLMASVFVVEAIVHVRKRRFVCSDATCRERVHATTPLCPACGVTLGRIIPLREQRAFAEEELERRVAATNIAFEECADCRPAVPRAVHRAG